MIYRNTTDIILFYFSLLVPVYSSYYLHSLLGGSTCTKPNLTHFHHISLLSIPTSTVSWSPSFSIFYMFVVHSIYIPSVELITWFLHWCCILLHCMGLVFCNVVWPQPFRKVRKRKREKKINKPKPKQNKTENRECPTCLLLFCVSLSPGIMLGHLTYNLWGSIVVASKFSH